MRQLSEGDANTAYFHLIARGRKCHNYIPALTVGGSTIEDHAAMETALHDHFAGVFCTAAEVRTLLNF